MAKVRASKTSGGGGYKIVETTLVSVSGQKTYTSTDIPALADFTSLRLVAVVYPSDEAAHVMGYIDDNGTYHSWEMNSNQRVASISGNTFDFKWNSAGYTFNVVLVGE